MPAKQKVVKCMVADVSTLRYIEAEHADMRVECLNRATVKRKLGSPETLIIHAGTNELRRTRNLDFVMGEVYALVATAKRKFPKCRLIMSGVARRRDVSWGRIGAFNDRKDWLSDALTLNSFDPNSWT